ncbi:MAG: hypothetical protein J6S83_14325, partial [Lachnospiraceae bacterium]|nr:hypothetical protein [Lachnospiraceae bacterium]
KTYGIYCLSLLQDSLCRFRLNAERSQKKDHKNDKQSKRKFLLKSVSLKDDQPCGTFDIMVLIIDKWAYQNTYRQLSDTCVSFLLTAKRYNNDCTRRLSGEGNVLVNAF